MSSAPTLLQRARKLLPYFRATRGQLWVAAIATILTAASEPLIPALMQPLLDHGFNATVNSLRWWHVPVILIGLFAFRGLVSFIAQYALADAAYIGMGNLRRAMFARLLNAHMPLFHTQTSSSLSNTLVYEVQNGVHALIYSLLTLVKETLTLLALLIYLLYLNWQLSCVVALLFPAVVWSMRYLSKRLHQVVKKGQTSTDELAYVVEENVLAHRMVRLHGAQDQQNTRFEILSAELRKLGLKAAVAASAMTPVTQLFSAAALSGVISMALWQSTSSGTTSVGGFVAFITAMLMLISPIKHLSESANPITRGLTALERGLELLENVPQEDSGTHTQAQVQGHIRFDHVSLSYSADPEAPPALRNISLDIAPGEILALVGPSGAGKTTLAHLVPRFVDATQGSVSLDGRDIREWNLENLRSHIAFVSQDVIMLSDTVAANVALGDPQIDRKRVTECLHAAHLSSLIDSLPQGIDTPLGHNARTLSGGQRQRLAIARALYKNAPVLILDEATSALDTESERAIQAALETLMQGRTTIIIAHRLSTIERAHRIAVLEGGRLAELGTHEALLQAQGLYARLYQTASL